MAPIDWRSPLEADDYAEYRDVAFLKRLSVTPYLRPHDFWPKRAPQWDGLGVAADGAVILVEAKAHLDEMISRASQASENSLELIQKSLDEVKSHLHAGPGHDWSATFYLYYPRTRRFPALRTFLRPLSARPWSALSTGKNRCSASPRPGPW